MKMRAPISTAVAIAVGMIILLGYFIPIPLLSNIRLQLIGWAVTLAGVAALVGIFNLIRVHWRRFINKENRDLYSIFVILAFGVTFVAGVWLKSANPDFQKVVTSIQSPIEVSLMAVLAISLAFSSLRLMQKRKGLMAVIFLISTLVFLVLISGFIPFSSNVPAFNNLVSFINQLPLAGARGILLGIALGSLMTGLRILLGADRPYSG